MAVALLASVGSAAALRSVWATGGFSDLDVTFLEQAISGKSGMYLDRSSNAVYDYDSGSRSLTLNPNPPSNVPILTVGSDLTFAEYGDFLAHNDTYILCDTTFCVNGAVRVVGNYDAQIVLQWSAHEQGSGNNKTVYPDAYPIDTMLGRPIVTGGDSGVMHQTTGRHCFIKAWVELRAVGSTEWNKNGAEEYFKCVKS